MNRKQGWAALAIILFLALLYISSGREQMDVLKPVFWAIGGLLLFVSYTTGLFAIAVGLASSALAFFGSLPVFSTFSAWLALTGAILYRTIINRIFKGFLERIPVYQKTVHKVKKNKRYRRLMAWINGVLNRLGLKKPKHIVLAEFKLCIHCRRWMPVDGRYCNYCGKENL
jgi:predicted membrane protein